MDRDELDAFFARADDVLDDWYGSADAMNTAVPKASVATVEVQIDGEWRPLGTVSSEELACAYPMLDPTTTTAPYAERQRALQQEAHRAVRQALELQYPGRVVVIGSLS